jgi:hypothetical protein
MEGKLLNGEGEFIASGPCEIDRDRNEVTMWPSWELHMLERERGAVERVPEHLAAGYVEPQPAPEPRDATTDIEMASGDAARIDQR